MGAADMKGRDVLSLADFTLEDINRIFETALELKRGVSRGEYQDHILRSKAAAMIFETPSSRTRMSFWRAMQQLGGDAQDLSGGKIWSDSGVEFFIAAPDANGRYAHIIVNPAGVVYDALNSPAQAADEMEIALRRRGEATDLFIESFPTYRFFPAAEYWEGRAREALRSPAASESYRAFLAMKRTDEDPLVADARKRLAAP